MFTLCKSCCLKRLLSVLLAALLMGSVVGIADPSTGWVDARHTAPATTAEITGLSALAMATMCEFGR